MRFVMAFQKGDFIPWRVTNGRDGRVIRGSEPVEITFGSIWPENGKDLVGDYREVEKKEGPEGPCCTCEGRINYGAVKFNRR